MLESLGRIQNPLVRSLTTAVTVGSAVTMAAAIALGITQAKENAAYRAALYTALAGAGCGAVLGLLYPARTGQPSPPAQPAEQTLWINSPTWKDWRNFVVMRKEKESEEITSYLQLEDGGNIPNFQPGQFLTIKLDIPGQPNL